MIIFRASAKIDKKGTLILLTPEQLKAKRFPFKNDAVRKEISSLSRSGQFAAKRDELFPINFKGKTIVLAGVGKKDELSATSLRVTVRQAASSSFLKLIKDIEVIPFDQQDTTVFGVIEGLLIGTYVWRKYRTEEKIDKSAAAKTFYLVAPPKRAYEDCVTICEGTNLTRDLINDNADTVTSNFMENTIKKIIKGKRNVSVEILNKKQLKAKGLNLHLAVNQGSVNEPKLVIVKYRGASASGKYTALIGKGMTFDTGGLNLKPSGSIEDMRIDMSGAAAVIGTLQNCIKLKLKKNVLFVAGLAENSIGPRAYKPGDVFKSYSGKTVEIGNTDAEGRLVLADAISYVVKNYKPARIIDIATLTGACIVALGFDYTGLVTNDDKFSRQLVHASNETDDRIWRLPTYPELKKSVKSEIADIRNLGFPKGAAGTLTAAEFLRQFTENTTWAHLDIAGTSFVNGAGRWYYGHGATGSGVRLLTRYLQKN